VLELRPNTKLRTSGTVIEWVLPSGAKIVKTAPENCYLVGNSVGSKGSSFVAVSSCSGLTGFIHANNNSYFIEPLKRKVQGYFHYENHRNSSLYDGEHRRESNLGYQEHRNYQQVFSVPEPHVIYKVNTILEKLNISLLNDHTFHSENIKDSLKNWSERSKRETKKPSRRKNRKRKSRKRRHHRKKGSRNCNKIVKSIRGLDKEEVGKKVEECQEKKIQRKREKKESKRNRKERRRNKERRRRNKNERKRKRKEGVSS